MITSLQLKVLLEHTKVFAIQTNRKKYNVSVDTGFTQKSWSTQQFQVYYSLPLLFVFVLLSTKWSIYKRDVCCLPGYISSTGRSTASITSLKLYNRIFQTLWNHHLNIIIIILIFISYTIIFEEIRAFDMRIFFINRLHIINVFDAAKTLVHIVHIYCMSSPMISDLLIMISVRKNISR